MNGNPIDIIDIADGVIMPADRDYIFKVNRDLSPETTGLIQVGAASISVTPTAVVVAGDLEANVTGDIAGNLSGQWYLDKGTYDPDNPDTDDLYAYLSPTGEIGCAEVRIGADLSTSPLAGIDEAGDATLNSVQVGPYAAPVAGISDAGDASLVSVTVGPLGGTAVAGIDATGAATLLSASIGTAGSEEVTIDATGITAPVFNGDLVRATAEFRSCNMQPDDIAGTEWARGSGVPIYTLGASQTGKILWGYVAEPEGRSITGWKTGGGFVDADTSGSLTAQLFSYPAGVETAVGASVSLTRDGARWSAAETLGSPVVLASNTVYAIKITATTGAGDSFTCDYCRVAAK